MIKLRCVVERITYQSPETGYSVLKCAVKNYNDLVTVVGNLVDANVGSVLLIDGNWKVDARYGRQFLAERWEETMPATVFGIEKYLGSGLIKGVGPKFAKKIVQQFGTDTLEIILMAGALSTMPLSWMNWCMPMQQPFIKPRDLSIRLLLCRC